MARTTAFRWALDPTPAQEALLTRHAGARRGFCHRLTAPLVETHDRLCLEELAVANLVRHPHLSRAAGDAAWADFARMVAYKAAWYGAEVATAPRFYPSTKRCLGCGRCREVGLHERTYRCGSCGLVLDRDTNAAANLAAWARASTTEAECQAPDRGERGRVTKARGGEGAGRRGSGGGTGPGEAGTP